MNDELRVVHLHVEHYACTFVLRDVRRDTTFTYT